LVAKATVVFKTAGDCAIHADVYGAEPDAHRPAILWLHGGALMFGDRTMIHPNHVARYVEAGYVVIAADYRLAPESKLPQIARDVQDAVAWVRTEGPRRFGVDPERLAVVGHSAGGYLTLLAGCTVQPRPQALVAFYGYGDIVGPWYSEPSPFYCQFPLVSVADANATVGTIPLSQPPDDGPDRSLFYLYCRQHGLWPLAATGHDPLAERAALLPYCPVAQIAADYPPTLLLHGDQDDDVPYEQSLAMAQALAQAGIEHTLLTIPGGEHGFDRRVNDPEVAAAFAQVLAFLHRHLQPNVEGPRQS
jgi:acetyl esterase/lipase